MKDVSGRKQSGCQGGHELQAHSVEVRGGLLGAFNEAEDDRDERVRVKMDLTRESVRSRPLGLAAT